MVDDHRKEGPKPDEPAKTSEVKPSDDADWSDGLGDSPAESEVGRTEAADWPEGLPGSIPDTLVEETPSPEEGVEKPREESLPDTLVEEPSAEPMAKPEEPEPEETQESAAKQETEEAKAEEETPSAAEEPERGASMRTIVSLALLLLALVCLWYVAYYRHTAGHLAAQLQSGNAQARMAAAEKLKSMGDDAESALPALVRALGDKLPPVRMNASSAIQGFSPEVRARADLYLLAELKDSKDSQVKTMIIRLLERKEKPSPEVVAALLERTRDKDKAVHQAATGALIKMSPDNAQFVDALFASLKQKALTANAAASLASLAVRNETILPRLIERIERGGPERAGALETVGRMGRRGKPAIPALAALAKKKETAWPAAYALCRIAPYQLETARALLPMCKSRNRGVRRRAASYLARCATKNAKALEMAKEALPDLPQDARRTLESQLRRAKKL